jgi:DNA-binding response OmpR family regulator
MRDFFNARPVSAKRILIVDANPSRRQQHAFGLRCAGFAVEETPDPPSARLQIARRFPNLLLICVALLDGGVQEFIQRLRATTETSDLPVAVLAERVRRSDAKHARDCGVDDLIAQPISPADFVARVHAAARERAGVAADTTSFAGLRFDEERCVVRRGQREAPLSPTEADLLRFFLAHAHEVVPRDVLLFRIWGGRSNVTARTVDVSVCRLRRALAQIGCDGFLQTINRRGYRLSDRPAAMDWRRAEQVARHEAPTNNPNSRSS